MKEKGGGYRLFGPQVAFEFRRYNLHRAVQRRVGRVCISWTGGWERPDLILRNTVLLFWGVGGYDRFHGWMFVRGVL
jgi:hypothetical protein